ncbi:MAG TPA: HEAT repeat domain-containing protein, partial [Syntrophales bacterium]|nr:HEAT repeat domain-containing protein [Syntrophales bacterium]
MDTVAWLTGLVLNREDSPVRAAALEVLDKLSKPGDAGWLLGRILDPDPVIRVDAVCSLGKLQDVRFIPELIRILLDDEIYYVRAAAVKALGNFGDASVPRILLQARHDTSEGVRDFAGRTLAAWIDEHPDSVGALLAIAQSDPSASVRAAALQALVKSNADPEEIRLYFEGHETRALAEIAPSGDSMWYVNRLTSADASVRAAAAYVLGVSGNADAVTALGNLLQNEGAGSVRFAAAQALGMLGSIAAIPALTEIVQADPDASVRAAAAQALASLGPQGIPVLIDALEDGSALVRESAAWALGELKAVGAVSKLRRAMQDEDATVRAAAKRTMDVFGDTTRGILMRQKTYDVRGLGITVGSGATAADVDRAVRETLESPASYRRLESEDFYAGAKFREVKESTIIYEYVDGVRISDNRQIHYYRRPATASAPAASVTASWVTNKSWKLSYIETRDMKVSGLLLSRTHFRAGGQVRDYTISYNRDGSEATRTQYVYLNPAAPKDKDLVGTVTYAISTQRNP